MSKEPRRDSEPPRLLLGAALLFWGGMIGHPVVGLLCALVVEGRAWVGIRWNFGEPAFTRAWGISLALFALTFAWLWMEGSGILSLFRLLRWWPVFFLPLILVQQYATSRSMLLNTFSLFARRKMQQDRREGREVDPVRIHFGYVYLTLVLMASALGGGSREMFFIGVCVFAGLALFFAVRTSRQRPLAWMISVSLAGILGLVGSVLLNMAFEYIESGRFLTKSSHTFPGESMTSIGRVGELKLSHDIRWRVQVEGAGAPSLYREAVFSKYGQGLWRHVNGGGLTQEEDFDNPMAQRGDKGDVDKRFVFDRRDLDIDAEGARRLVLTGSLNARGPTPLPLPTGTRLIRGLQADGIDFNSLGTVVVVNPDAAVTRFEAYQRGVSRNEEAPYEGTDFQVPEAEVAAVRKVVDELGLRGRSEREILAELKLFFGTEFTYTLYRRSHKHIGPDSRGSMAEFLEVTRRGHCEYFATAATLILREAGVPARYAVGYAAKEQDGDGEWILRGQHGHAWCRVYLGGRPGELVEGADGVEVVQWTGGRWVDFDPTPGSWLAIEGSGLPWEQAMIDWWHTTRQELLIWRSRAENRNRVSWAMAIIGIAMVGYVFVRLWRSRLRRERSAADARNAREGLVLHSPLATLVKAAERILGPRPEGRPLTDWILEAGEVKPALAPALERAVRFHWRARFDPLGLESEEREQFQDLCRMLRKKLRA